MSGKQGDKMEISIEVTVSDCSEAMLDEGVYQGAVIDNAELGEGGQTHLTLLVDDADIAVLYTAEHFVDKHEMHGAPVYQELHEVQCHRARWGNIAIQNGEQVAWEMEERSNA